MYLTSLNTSKLITSVFYDHPAVQIIADPDGKILLLNKKAEALKEKLEPDALDHLVFNQIKSRQVLSGESIASDWKDEIEIQNTPYSLNVVELSDSYLFSFELLVAEEEIFSKSDYLLQDHIVSNSDIIHFEIEYSGKGDVQCNYISKAMLNLYPSLGIDFIRENLLKMMSTVHVSDHELLWDSLEKASKKMEMWWQDFKVTIEDGTEIWVEGKARPFRSANNRIVFIGHFMRIENRKTLETELSKTKFEYKELFNSIHHGVCVVDNEQRIIGVNPYSHHILGMKEREMLGKKFSALEPFKVDEKNQQAIDKHWESSKSHIIPIKNNEQIKHVEIDYYTPEDVENENNSPHFIMMDDITEIVNYEQELLRTNHVFKLASRAVNEAIWEWDIENKLLKWGEGMQRIFKYDSADFPTIESWGEYIHPEDYVPTRAIFKRALVDQENDRWSATYRFKDGKGNYIYVSDNAYILRDQEGKALQVIGSMRDITATIDNAKEKMNLISEAIKKERKYISMELHDNLGQYLIALNLYLNRIRTLDKDLIDKCKELTNEALTQARALCYKMTPPELSRGFLQAVEELAVNINMTHEIKFELNFDENITEKDFRYIDEYQNFRILQEFVNNSIRHSKCTTIACSIKKVNREIVIKLKDDGEGYDQNSMTSNGFGIENMYYRARLANSILILRSMPGKGTQLELKLKNIHFIP